MAVLEPLLYRSNGRASLIGLGNEYQIFSKRMAGAVGFEPTIHDTKNRCLTTWPRPNLFNAAT